MYVGPAIRFVAQFERGDVDAETSQAGGQSGVLGSDHYTDLLLPWLTNDTFPVLTRPLEIIRASEKTEHFRPSE